MRTVILVPRREGIAERDAIWRWCRARWEALHPELAIYEGHHDVGPFNRSAAINLASRLADEDGHWDLAVIVDADVFLDPDQVRQAIERAGETGKVTWAFQEWCGLTEEAAVAIVAGEPTIDAAPTFELEKRNPISWSCCFVVPRAVFDDLDGFDERFAGWGWEDLAFMSAVVGLHGHERIPGDIYHLWHPRHPGLGDDGANKRRNRQLGRRYMYALRVKGYHDRATESDEAEMERDRQNLLELMHREETDRQGRPVVDLPDWTAWLPSLEELVQSWKDRNEPGPPARIAIVVRSGGPADRWPDRSSYLRETLASLDAHVEYEHVVARVIFSDWPADVADELGAIAAEHGFYVVGEGNTGFTASMQKLWRYLASRTWSYDHVFLVEDDFRFERDVDLGAMAAVLHGNRHLVQVALLRDACYPAERERGGILGHPLDEFSARRDGDAAWLEHRRFFTLNPCLFRRSLVLDPWPGQQHSEAVFGRRLFKNEAMRAALWGEGEAWITHLGTVRAGAGY